MNIAFIFARGGSKGIKNKNVKLFNGKPLIFYSIDIAKKSKLIDDVYVSTESNKIANISSSFGAKIIKRPKYLAKDNSDEWLAWQHAVKYVNKKKIKINKFISLPCTSPLRKLSDVEKCITMSNKKNDLVISYCRTNHNPWFNMVVINQNKFLSKGLKTKKKIFCRQDSPKVFDMCTVAYVAKPSYILKEKNLFTGKIMGIEIPKERSIDIDDMLDFKFAEYIYKNSII